MDTDRMVLQEPAAVLHNVEGRWRRQFSRWRDDLCRATRTSHRILNQAPRCRRQRDIVFVDLHFSVDQEEEHSRRAVLRDDCLASAEISPRKRVQNFEKSRHEDEQ